MSLNFSKYSKESQFSDPVVRCLSCRKLVVVAAQIAEKGKCVCGSRRFAEVRQMSEKEFDAIKSNWPDFAQVFAPQDDSGLIVGMPGVKP